MERLFLIIIVVFSLFSGCSNAKAFIEVTSGNFRFGQGEYEKANIEYLHALDKGLNLEIIHYNLGNVYYALGEPSAAREEWLKAISTDNEDLLFDIYFNLGALQYDLGEYDKAYVNFREALFIKSADIDAKKNLELSIQKMLGKGIADIEPADEDIPETVSDSDDEVRRILEFVRRKEEGWLNRPDTPVSPSKSLDW